MKTHEETFRTVLKKRDEIVNKKQQRNASLKRTLVPAACGIAVVLAGVGLWRGGIFQKAIKLAPTAQIPQGGIDSPEPTYYKETELPVGQTEILLERQTEIAPDRQTTDEGNASRGQEEPSSGGMTLVSPENTRTPNEAVSEGRTPIEGPSDGGSYGGDTPHYSYVPLLPQNLEIVATGETVTDEEAKAYFAERKASLASALSASGVPADNIRIGEKGYSHVCYNGYEGERLEARENFRDYLVYNGDTLIAIVTLTKENGTISDTLSLGAPWFADYSAFLKTHRGEELVFVYAKWTEIILTPDGGMYSPLAGVLPEVFMEGIEDPYHLFYHPSAVYVP